MTGKIVIRETVPADLAAIVEVHKKGFGYDKEAGLTAELLSDPTAEPTVSLLALRDGEAVGHILGNFRDGFVHTFIQIIFIDWCSHDRPQMVVQELFDRQNAESVIRVNNYFFKHRPPLTEKQWMHSSAGCRSELGRTSAAFLELETGRSVHLRRDHKGPGYPSK